MQRKDTFARTPIAMETPSKEWKRIERKVGDMICTEGSGDVGY
jgi:hypothetical protein